MDRRLINNGGMDEGAKVPGQDALLKPEANITSGNGTSRSHTPRRRKLIRLALAVLVAAVAVTVWLVWDSTPTGPPQIVTLPNGEQYQFAGVTYGTKNVPPSLEAKVVNLLPKPLANLARKYVGPRISQYGIGASFETPQIFVWFKRLGANVPLASTSSTLTARLADQSGLEAGEAGYAAFASSVVWSYAAFPVSPRRSPLLQCNFYPDVSAVTPNRPVGGISFPNPLYGHFPQSKPEPVPEVKMAGDVEVRLADFAAGGWVGRMTIVKADGSRILPYAPAVRGQDTETAFDVSFRSPRGTNEVWALRSAELSDATGNIFRIKSPPVTLYEHFPQLPWGSISPTTIIRGTLWPDEAAWRLKLEVKRVSGFVPEEIVTFKNVPVPVMGTTNTRPITKTAGGTQIVLTRFFRQPNITSSGYSVGIEYSAASQVMVELPGKPEGVAVDFLGMKTDAGQAEKYGSSGGSDFSCEVFLYYVPTNAKTMDFTFVVQKTRAVEFLVAPPKPQ